MSDPAVKTRDFISIRNEMRAAIDQAIKEHGDMAKYRILVSPELEQRIVDTYPRAANMTNPPERGRTMFCSLPVCARPFVPHSRACLIELVQEDPDRLDPLTDEDAEDYDEDLADWIGDKVGDDIYEVD